MIAKGLSVFLVLLGFGMLMFAGGAYFELRAAATSETPPSADAMPLTKIVGQEFFAPDNAGMKPAELAGQVFNRIYTIAGGGIVAVILGVLILVVTKSRRQDNRAL